MKTERKIMEEGFRKELLKIMPGYKWTVHKFGGYFGFFEATGTQSSGSNRTSTLSVKLVYKDKSKTYTVKSSGYGLRSPWLNEASGDTLAQALRTLQDGYEWKAQNYRGHAEALRCGRVKHD